MQLTNTLKTKIALSLLAMSAISASSSTYALSTILEGSFKTIKDVTVTTVTPMAINGLLMSASTGECTMAVDNTDALYPGDTLMKMASTSQLNAPGTNVGAIPAGTNACVKGTGTVGIYEVDGSPGAVVKITFIDKTTGSVGFAPSGCAGHYNGAGDGDTCLTIVSGTSAHKLAGQLDTTNSAGEGAPEPGKLRIALGGVADALVGLSAATTYPVTFDMTVTY
ncbi:MAG: hypothetical protein ACI87J_002063 [Colwellia sp.]|jgi:hypothetical protein